MGWSDSRKADSYSASQHIPAVNETKSVNSVFTEVLLFRCSEANVATTHRTSWLSAIAFTLVLPSTPQALKLWFLRFFDQTYTTTISKKTLGKYRRRREKLISCVVMKHANILFHIHTGSPRGLRASCLEKYPGYLIRTSAFLTRLLAACVCAKAGYQN
jgi:hypothetical protein